MTEEKIWHVILVHALPMAAVCMLGTPFIEYREKLNWWQNLIYAACLLSVIWFIYGAWVE